MPNGSIGQLKDWVRGEINKNYGKTAKDINKINTKMDKLKEEIINEIVKRLSGKKNN